MENSIEKQIELKAPVSRVWRALTDHKEFGAWFGVKFTAPFKPGELASGQITIPNYDHLQCLFYIEKMQPESYFSYKWHPYAIDPAIDYTKEEPTLVEFRLEKTATGTLLRITESGFDKIPAHRRSEALGKNDNGWAQQIKNIERYVAQND
jgi:uncharacterized protein YndB with AHSA1/START domain